MSRTYRRRNCASQFKWELSDDGATYKFPNVELDVAKRRAKARFHSDSQWVMTVPGWWRHMSSTVPQRQQTRALVNKVHKLVDIEDTPEFPIWNRPRIWFW